MPSETLPPVRLSARARADLPELMDDLAADPGLTRQSLRELAFLNTYFGGYPIVLGAFDRLLPRLRALGRPVRVLDLATGSGDVLRKVAQWARRRNLPLTGVGIDINPVMAAYASAQSQGYPELRYEVADSWSRELLAHAPDVVLSSQFCHHLSDDELVRYLRWLYELSGTALVVSDLHRHPVAFHFIRLATRVFSRSEQVRYDAPLSVARGMTGPEWRAALAAAGISGYRLGWRWAFRWQIVVAK